MPIGYAPLYDVTHAVGRGGSNDKLDVMLVQFFLFSIYLDSGWPVESIFRVDVMPRDGGKAIFPMNGTFTPGLITWIEAFQQASNQQGLGPLSVDGKISHAGTAWGNRHPTIHKKYTIQVLNELLFKSSKNRYWNLFQDPSFPGPLRQELSVFRFAFDPKL